jgi:hypothetical protein
MKHILTDDESRSIITGYKIGKEFEHIFNLLGIEHDNIGIYVTTDRFGEAKIAITYSGKSWELNVIKEDRFLSLDDFSSCFVGPLIKQIIRETDL